MNDNFMKTQIFHNSWTSKVIEGHKRYFLRLKINFFLNMFFVKYLILTKFCMNDYIIKTLFFHNMMFDLKGHIRSNKALYIFSSNNSSVKPLLSKPLYHFSLSLPSSLLLFFSLCLSIFSLSLVLLLAFSSMPLYLFSFPRSSSLFF